MVLKGGVAFIVTSGHSQVQLEHLVKETVFNHTIQSWKMTPM